MIDSQAHEDSPSTHQLYTKGGRQLLQTFVCFKNYNQVKKEKTQTKETDGPSDCSFALAINNSTFSMC